MSLDEDEEKTVDVFGFGRVATAIPPKVYERIAFASVAAIEKLIAPLTATSSGLGRYVQQRFDNMVAVEKAVGAFTLEKAVDRARHQAASRGLSVVTPASVKTFVKAIEEAARESDPLLHEMWANLIASQISGDSHEGHAHFVATLSHLGRGEALLFLELLSFDDLGPNGGGYLGGRFDGFRWWMRDGTSDPRPWTVTCTLLIELGLVDMVAPPQLEQAASEADPNRKYTTMLYRSKLGQAFLRAVSFPDN